MKLYRTTEGEWVGTQAEAKNKNVIEVPVDKPGLLEWLNANCRTSEVDQRDASVDTDNAVVSGGIGDRQKVTNCPNCKLNLHAAAEKAERELAGAKADAIAKYLETCPNGRVAEVFIALADRYQARE